MNDILFSQVDNSVNFINDAGDGFFETRYVQRPNTDYFIAYLSSHNGCNKACRFCHLTATGQTMMEPASEDGLYNQFLQVVSHYLNQPEKLDNVHINFMARGEPLASPVITDPRSWASFSCRVADLCQSIGLKPTFRISTIMPQEVADIDLAETFLHGDEVLYYSLYSVNPSFRKRWLPKAIDPVQALQKLAKWQDDTGQDVKIHFSLIDGHNDSIPDVYDVVKAVQASGLDTTFNIVRFNSPNDKYQESTVLDTVGEILNDSFPGSRIIPRVGPDVYASCGMFINR